MIELGRFRALTFDCYGTLVDWESGIVEFASAHLPGHQAPEPVLAAFAALETKAQQADPAARYPVILERVWTELASRFGWPVDPAVARAFGSSVPTWPPFRDTASALAELKGRFVLGVLSNVDEASLRGSLAALGNPFELVVTAEAVGSYKPAPGHFEEALRRLADRGIAKSEVLHVAQSKFHDIQPARALGIHTLWIDRRQGRPGGATPEVRIVPDFALHSLAELVALVHAGIGR